ncbi:MAG: hypothetical protein INQ03_10585 [Candidatus Heimdallarchaeota archaeon]|nr:hypothetical protein [Candidatus Heimdallarchaeota archaeon]
MSICWKCLTPKDDEHSDCEYCLKTHHFIRRALYSIHLNDTHLLLILYLLAFFYLIVIGEMTDLIILFMFTLVSILSSFYISITYRQWCNYLSIMIPDKILVGPKLVMFILFFPPISFIIATYYIIIISTEIELLGNSESFHKFLFFYRFGIVLSTLFIALFSIFEKLNRNCVGDPKKIHQISVKDLVQSDTVTSQNDLE